MILGKKVQVPSANGPGIPRVTTEDQREAHV